jgi:regulator of protease activity HflC (stomatin/prohibitin superfamily)
MFPFLKNKLIRSAAFCVIGLFLFLIFLNPITFIQSHERGLRFTMGALSEKVLNSGVQLRLPIIQKIETVTVRPIQKDSKIEVGGEGAITKDNQTIGASITIFYVYRQAELVKMWKGYGEDKIETLITSAVKESFKSTIGQFTIFELPLSQEPTRAKTFESVKEKLSNYPVDVTELRITNYDWSDAFDKQIQATMQKAQEVKQKEQELKITELETQKAVKKAEADKQATITIAEGEKAATQLRAEAKVLEGEGIRKFNESIRATQDIEIKLRQLAIESNRVEKWNGVYVPTNNYGPIPFVTGAVQGK